MNQESRWSRYLVVFNNSGFISDYISDNSKNEAYLLCLF